MRKGDELEEKQLWWIFAVTKGGIVRARIVRHLRERPMNANQLARELGLDYTTVRYHLDILLKSGVVVPSKDTYIVMYFLSDAMEEAYEEFLRIYEKIKGDSKAYGETMKLGVLPWVAPRQSN